MYHQATSKLYMLRLFRMLRRESAIDLRNGELELGPPTSFSIPFDRYLPYHIYAMYVLLAQLCRPIKWQRQVANTLNTFACRSWRSGIIQAPYHMVLLCTYVHDGPNGQPYRWHQRRSVEAHRHRKMRGSHALQLLAPTQNYPPSPNRENHH